jgi:subtilisin-like proprotein convertase family protein
MNAKKTLLLLGSVVLVCAAQATIYTTNWTGGVNVTFANGGLIPDGNLSGWSDTRNVSTMPGGTLQGVAVNLNLSSGWTGDLYAYLVHGSGFSVLLNHVGQGTGSNPTLTYGYGAGTMNVTLADDGFNGLGLLNSIHGYGGGSVAGNWNPDSAGLASFVGTSPNGTWSLFMADLSTGELTTVGSWGLQMDIVAVPEIETWVAAALAGAFGAFWLNRQLFTDQKKS